MHHWFWKGVWLTAASMVVGHVWLLMASTVIVVVIVNGGWLSWVAGAGDNKW